MLRSIRKSLQKIGFHFDINPTSGWFILDRFTDLIKRMNLVFDIVLRRAESMISASSPPPQMAHK